MRKLSVGFVLGGLVQENRVIVRLVLAARLLAEKFPIVITFPEVTFV